MAAIHGQAPALLSRRAGQSSFQPQRVPPPTARHSVVMRSTGWADPAATRAENAMFGQDFGARDPTAAELASNFTEKVLGNYNTDHIIKVPTSIKDFLGLTAAQCVPAAQLSLLEEKELNLLKQQIPGWKVVTGKSGLQVLRHEWKLRSVEAAAQLQALISGLGQEQSHAAEVTVSGDILIAELTTPLVKGLSINDLIMAAKVNALNVKDLLPPPRKRYWA